MRLKNTILPLFALTVFLAVLPARFSTTTLDTHSEPALAGPLDTPEQLAAEAPFDLTLGAGYAFWTRLVGEFCSPPGALKSVHLTTRVINTLQSDCNINPGSVVADDTYIYYADWTSDTIKRISVTGGSPTTLANASGLTFHRALALDSTYVYYGDEDGLWRVPITGGSPQLLASGYDASKMALDETHAYWTERSPGGGGAIRRVAKIGGAVNTIVSGGSLDDPWAIAVDATHVYWTELGSGKARRISKGGGVILDYVSASASYQGGDIAVNSSHVFWTDTTGSADGRLRRAPLAGGSVEDLALGLFGPGGVNLSPSHVYWGDSGGIWRLPLAAGGVAVDLTIAALEITQGIQNLANDVPLVQDKPTYVRAYPSVDMANTPNVTAVLHGFRGGVPLPGSPLNPVVPTVYVRLGGYNRGSLNDSFYFWIPPSWRSGNVTFRGEINPGGIIPESDADNNNFSVTRTFNSKDPLCVDMVRVRTEPTTASINDAGFWDAVDWLRAAHPVPDVWIYRGGKIEELQVCWAGIFPYPCHGPYEMPDDSSKVLASLWWYNLWTNDPGECNDQAYYFGMVHQSHLSQGGAGYRPGDEAWGAMNMDPNYLGGAWSWYIPHAGSTLSHELGHNLNRKHVDCGGPADPDAGYPYNNCDIGPNDPTAYYGFDVLDVAVIPPTSAGDLMSYAMSVGKPRWPSDYTYRALYNALPGMASSLVPGASLAERVISAVEVLAVTGTITPTQGTARLDYAFRLDNGLVSNRKLSRLAENMLAGPGAAYSVRLLDASDMVLSEVDFDLPDEGDPVGEGRSFNLFVPWDPSTAAVILAQGSTELVRVSVSPNPPGVQVVRPNGGENISGQMTIEWTASDPDEDTLLFTVQYSSDGGSLWQTVAANYVTTTLVLDNTDFIPGSSTALIRVIASDGINTASDTSDATFQVSGQAPDVHISQPADGSVHDQGTQVILNGIAIDTEDGTLSGASLEWSLDGTPVATGTEASLVGLTPGVYEITLEATDSDLNPSADTVYILVPLDKISLPIVLR